MKTLSLREATKSDVSILFKWTNDKLCRDNSFNQDKVVLEEHTRWFDRVISDPNIYLYIMEELGIPCGVIRININHNDGVISFSIDRDFRGKGFGIAIISLLEQKILDQKICLKRLIGKVKYHNYACQKAFVRCGFTETKREDWIEYEKIIKQQGDQMKKVIFVVHGGSLIGMGHIIRSMALAHSFVSEEFDVTYISKFDQGIHELNKNGYPVIPINTILDTTKNKFEYINTEELENEKREIKKILADERPDVIVVDSYNVDNGFFYMLKTFTTCLVYIDDLNMFHYSVDILVNGTIYANTIKYTKTLPNQQFLLGTKYNLIRDEFINISHSYKCTDSSAQNVLITVGGSDPYHMTEKIILLVMEQKQFEEINYYVVIGNAFKNRNNIEDIAKKYSNIRIYYDPPNMANVISQCDFAISAGGCTMYELAICGIPALIFAYAENQLMQISFFEKMDTIRFVGMYHDIDKEDFLYKYQNAVNDPIWRKESSLKLCKLVDGKGSERIVKKVNNFLDANL